MRFWDYTESNNSLRTICTDNVVVGPVGADSQVGKRGFLQTWSRSPLPWTLEYSGNVLTNVRVGGKVGHNSLMYAPNASDSDRFKIDLTATCTNVFKVFSFLYKKNDGSTASNDKWILDSADYTPENIGAFPSVPAVVNPNSYAVVQPP